MDEQLEQKVALYLEGRLPETEKLELEAQMSQDPDLKAEVDDLMALQNGLQSIGYHELKNEVKQWDQELTTARNFNWRPLAVAAALALLLIPAIYLFQGNNEEDLFYAYYEPYEEQLLSRGLADSTSSAGHGALVEGLEAYNAKKFDQCAQLLSEYLTLQPQEHRVALYLAIAQLELGQSDEAEANFQRARQDPDFEQQAVWYQALSYLKFGQQEQAVGLLNDISQREFHYRKDQALSLLAEL